MATRERRGHVSCCSSKVGRRRESIDVGITRLETAILSLFDQPTSAIVDGVLAELTASSAIEDDIVVAAFRYSPALDHLQVSVPARPEHLALVRRQVGSWLTSVHATPDTHQAVQLAVGEACTNAIDHAYRLPAPGSNGDQIPPDGEIFIELADHGHEIVARVRDHGTWRPLEVTAPVAVMARRSCAPSDTASNEQRQPQEPPLTLSIPAGPRQRVTR